MHDPQFITCLIRPKPRRGKSSLRTLPPHNFNDILGNHGSHICFDRYKYIINYHSSPDKTTIDRRKKKLNMWHSIWQKTAKRQVTHQMHYPASNKQVKIRNYMVKGNDLTRENKATYWLTCQRSAVQHKEMSDEDDV